MTTFTRKLRRKAARKGGNTWVGKEQPSRVLPDGGYETLTPTGGWKRFSMRRLIAIQKMRAFEETMLAKPKLKRTFV